MPRLRTIPSTLAPLRGKVNPVPVTVDRIRGRELQRIRAAEFQANPLCVECKAMDPPRVSLATVLDHTVALVNGGPDADGNRQGLCEECHAAKTKRDLAQARGA